MGTGVPSGDHRSKIHHWDHLNSSSFFSKFKKILGERNNLEKEFYREKIERKSSILERENTSSC